MFTNYSWKYIRAETKSLSAFLGCMHMPTDLAILSNPTLSADQPDLIGQSCLETWIRLLSRQTPFVITLLAMATGAAPPPITDADYDTDDISDTEMDSSERNALDNNGIPLEWLNATGDGDLKAKVLAQAHMMPQPPDVTVLRNGVYQQYFPLWSSRDPPPALATPDERGSLRIMPMPGVYRPAVLPEDLPTQPTKYAK